MRTIRIFSKISAVVLTVICVAVFTLIVIAERRLSEQYFVVEGKQLSVDCQIPITTHYNGVEESRLSLVENGRKSDYSVNFRLFGLFPVSNADITVIDNMSVRILGVPFGMKIYTDGVMVVDMSDVDTESGNVNPAKDAGIKIGDTIKSINGISMRSNDDVSKIVQSSDGSPMTIEILRKKVLKTVTVIPQKSKSAGAYRIGLWVRDSTAGIGTLTFYSPATEMVCGLGHGVCDDDTGQLISISGGEIVDADIVSLTKGKIGAPGELKGRLGNLQYGELLLNCECGVYALNTYNFGKSELVNVALKQEIKDGEAFIYTTIEGTEPNYYSCQIKINVDKAGDKTQNMVIKVTDKRLIDKTGGIVQGMSGSPILQNGRLVGAVTHVLVDDPTKGYAIFAENMLETAQLVSEQQLKEAS